jgi:hypothetical protein
MQVFRSSAIAGLALAAFAGGGSGASAASSYASCTGFIDAVPMTILTPGTWCLRRHLAANMTSGNAIDVQTNNVTIDCNGFVLDNSSADPGAAAIGVLSFGYSAITVRNCIIQGFPYGINVFGGSPPRGGYVIEKNRLLKSLLGIVVEGYGSVIRDNIVVNSHGGGSVLGIIARGGVDVIDNVVDGLFGDTALARFRTTGIYYTDSDYNPDIGSQIRGNRVRNLTEKGNLGAVGIDVSGHAVSVHDNIFAQAIPTSGIGVECRFGDGRLRDNIIKNYSIGMDADCADDGGNVAY